MAIKMRRRLKALLALPTILLLAGWWSEPKIAAFNSRDSAADECFKHLEKEIVKEVNGTSDIRKDNWSAIKDDDEQYLILGYTCKPSFKKGDSIGELIPLYFYLDETGEIKWRWVRNYTGNEEDVKYTYPLGKRIDFESIGFPNKESKVSWFINPFEMPFTSIKSDAFVTGVAFGSVLRLCRSTYLEKSQTEEEAEMLFQRDRKYIMKMLNNQEGYIYTAGPTSEKAKKIALSLMDSRWKSCKEEGYEGWEKSNV